MARRVLHLLVVTTSANALVQLHRAACPHIHIPSPLTAALTPRARRASDYPSMLTPESVSDLYKQLFVAPPFEVRYVPEFYDEGLNIWIDRRIDGIDVTPAGWTLIAITLAWTIWSPYGLVAYYRRGGRFPSQVGSETPPAGKDGDGEERDEDRAPNDI